MKENEKLTTILRFIFVKDENSRLNQFFKEINLSKIDMSFNFIGANAEESNIDNDSFDAIDNKVYLDSAESNDIKFDVDLDENNIYYYENINLVPKEKSNIPNISFEYPIYKNKINIIYFDEENIKGNNSISLEIMYQTIKADLLPKDILYKGKKLDLFDSFKNKLRKRFGFCNVDPNQFKFTNEIYKSYPNFKFINNNTYQILVRVPEDNNNVYSITKSSVNTKYFKKIKKIYQNKEVLLEKLKAHKNEFKNTFVDNQFDNVNEVEDIINKFDDEYKMIEMNKYYYDNIYDYCDFTNIDIDIFILMFYYLEFLILREIKSDQEKKFQIIDVMDLLSDFNAEYEKYISEIRKLNIDNLDKLLLIQAYNTKFIDAYRSGYQIDYITVVNVEKVEKENELNPYIKAINFIKEIINNLKEESRLFEVFLYLDSDVIKNLLINQEKKTEEIKDIYGSIKKIEIDENPTEYGINMINIDEVRNHLIKLIPKYIIRIDTRMKFNADFDNNCKIMTLNERKLFNKSSKGLNKTFQKENVSDKYVLPISLEILHELFGHGKKRLLDNKSKSPEDHRDSKHNYKRISITKIVSDFKEIIYPESGYVLENYISEDRNIVKWLKSIHPLEEGKKLLDISLWVDEGFNNLEKIVKDFIDKDSSSQQYKSQFSLSVHEDDLFEFSDNECGFQNK